MSKEEKDKKNPFKINGTFSIHITDRKAKKAIIHSIKEDCIHIRNMLLILRHELYEQSKTSNDIKEIYNLFLSHDILRETVYGRIGKDENAIKIKKLKMFFATHEVFNALCDFSQKKLDPKNFISILKEIKKNFDNYFTSLDSFIENPIEHARKMGNSGMPKPPNPKKLVRINNASLIIESSKWSLKKETKLIEKLVKTKNKKGIVKKKLTKVKKMHYYIRVKIGKHTCKIPENWTKFNIPEGQTLRSLNISHSNGSVYLNFSYGALQKSSKKQVIKKSKKVKCASGDVGLLNTLSLFINDLTTPSFILSGKRFIKYNCTYNKTIAKLNNSISKEAIKWKEIERSVKNADGDFVLDKNGEKVKEVVLIPTEYNARGKELRAFKSFLTEKRNRFFCEEFEKISTHLVEYFEKVKVTDFVTSKNLSFAKTEGSIKMRKKTKQKFYQIPFGSLLNMIERKCKNKGIDFHDIDEAHTSKTSCLSKNVNEMVKLRAKSQKSLSTNVYGGKRVKRGFYKDFAHNILFHADINGAINHLKVKFKKLDFEWLLENKTKMCNPYLFKSDYDFRRQMLGESQLIAA